MKPRPMAKLIPNHIEINTKNNETVMQKPYSKSNATNKEKGANMDLKRIPSSIKNQSKTN